VETGVKAPEGLVDVAERRRATVPKEVESWLNKLERDPEISPSQQSDPGTGAQVAQIKQNLRQRTKLGVKRSSFIAGFGQSVANVARWLSTFILRLIKKHEGDVEFEKEEV
jgi:hypothetical protein